MDNVDKFEVIVMVPTKEIMQAPSHQQACIIARNKHHSVNGHPTITISSEKVEEKCEE